MTRKNMDVVRFWHFHCVECGFGDVELGHLAGAHDVHCTVCLIETGKHIRLRRWEADESETVTDTAKARRAA
ncbi:MAG: hypothetical protein J0H14_06885 [Alphaproteobacteria bacterium]|nr:hypothetical protein [Alphaproteobacteria bacterium]